MESMKTLQAMEKQGGFCWGLKNLRKDVLVQFIKDLDREEKRGLTDAQCDAVKNALRDLETEATEVVGSEGILSKWFDKPFYKILHEFRKEYSNWNSDGHCPDLVTKIAHRMECTDRLRDIRYEIVKCERRIVKKIRRDMHTLGADLDIRRVDAMHRCFEGLCEAVPEIFVNLSRALARYRRKMKGKDLATSED